MLYRMGMLTPHIVVLPLNPFVFGNMSWSHTLHEVQVHNYSQNMNIVHISTGKSKHIQLWFSPFPYEAEIPHDDVHTIKRNRGTYMDFM